MVVVALKEPSGRTAAPTAGTPAKSWVWTKALESRVTPLAHSEPAESGPTDPDTVTLPPAATELGLTRRVTGAAGAAHAGTVRRVRMANTTAAMIRTGRMATSLCSDDPMGPGHQCDLGRSRAGDRRVSRQARTGLDLVAVVNQNEHDWRASRRFRNRLQALNRQPPTPGNNAQAADRSRIRTVFASSSTSLSDSTPVNSEGITQPAGGNDG